MQDRTVRLAVLLLFTVVFLLNLSAKKQPSDKETEMFDVLQQPRAWREKLALDISLDFLNGDRFILAEHVGKKVVVLNFFATWCGPCKDEMPELVRFSEKHKDEPLLLIGINAGEREDAVREFIRNYGVSYPVAIDKDNAAQKAFSVRAFPTTVFIGPDGIVHLYEVGPIQNADVAFEAIYRVAIETIKAGKGITKEAFLQQQTSSRQVAGEAVATVEEKKDPEDDVPPGRPREIAMKMNYPCGCTHRLMDCTCKTSKDVKARLKSMDLQKKLTRK